MIESFALSSPSESLGVRSALDRRIDALGQGRAPCLTVAAVIGREAPDALVEAVLRPELPKQALAAVEAAGLMRGEAGTARVRARPGAGDDA